ncbi:hypothetical protein [Microbacterium candidum]|uniref:HNH endonuclease n=1 Tax=Microbacterium candidum TaxID=3041922 RepID=A0ABT7MW17_9MICO|nr:hypothetical protein [Microbacterium sp. ASV49]MDL9978613.1 hypothetical protein [Microbacterium sp. ASV49]
MHTWDMLVETPVCEADIDDRNHHPGHDSQNQCSYCGIGENRPWYDIHDVTLIRHWTTSSQDVPGGGHWTWYCPEHLDKRNGNWWRSSHLAPERLKPEVRHFCGQRVEFGENCGGVAIEPFDGLWMCERHAAAERVNRRIRDLLGTNDPLDEG